ncbi:hypothetical protein CEXT_135111 [Caerostris extrusa]|uniref:Uncharacterized protein n=1 Tax=Caerostris extrusa TaxID=172846 RepID=A0AAV4ULN8_CAEEX|nr:hypothetical protein CEXT_135111 [Caerostris extrusa]
MHCYSNNPPTFLNLSRQHNGRGFFDDPLFKMQAGRRTIQAVEEHLSSPDILERGLSSRNINSAQPGFFHGKLKMSNLG